MLGRILFAIFVLRLKHKMIRENTVILNTEPIQVKSSRVRQSKIYKSLLGRKGLIS